MKSSYYFDHDYNARNDQRILELRSEYGWEGYGIYFALIECLCESGGEIKRGALGGLSLGLNLDKNRLNELIEYMVNVGLLIQENDAIYSKRVKEHLSFRTMLSEAGKRGGRGKKKPPFNPPKAPPEAGKERKEDNSKVNTSSWRQDFNVYLKTCKEEYNKFYNDEEFIKRQEYFHPNVNIKKSIWKGFDNFWGTEAGWKHKKKSRSNEIDWRQTIINSIDMNKVFYTKEEMAKG